MAPKATDTRVQGMEKELEEVKSRLQRLPAIERNVEQLMQGLAQLFQAMEDTQCSVAAMAVASAN